MAVVVKNVQKALARSLVVDRKREREAVAKKTSKAPARSRSLCRIFGPLRTVGDELQRALAHCVRQDTARSEQSLHRRPRPSDAGRQPASPEVTLTSFA
jgi:hypothetical protein